MWTASFLASLFVLALGTVADAAVTCDTQGFEERPFTVCSVDARQDDLRLFLDDASGKRLGQFSAVDDMLEGQDQQLVFAMNGGMYHDDRAPVGHYIEDGQERMRVIPNAGPGNFGLLPNGVFCIREDRADVIETLRYSEEMPDCQFATQSGPMLVIDGALHPRFLVDSTSRYIRNGVGTTADGARAFFVISDEAVTFHEFGRFFRDVLGVPQALFLDGNISRLHAPQINRSDFGRWMGPIVGVVGPLNP